MNTAVQHEVLDRLRPLWFDDRALYAASGLRVLRSIDAGRNFEPIAEYPASLFDRIVSRNSRSARLFRAGFHGLRLLPDGGMIGAVRKTIVHKRSDDDYFRKVLHIERGSRPLRLCITPEGVCYFGEYFRNPDRDSVRIFASNDGQQWRVAYTFAPGEVRHIHGVFWDRYRRGVWVLSGDTDRESALWFTNDGFETLRAVVRGSQRTRAVAVIPAAAGLVVPTDTPLEQNYIQWLDLESTIPSLSVVCKLPGSGIHATEVDGIYLVSTMVEPSDVNPTSTATVYASVDGNQWKCISAIEGEKVEIPLAQAVLGYPHVALAPSTGRPQHIFAEARGLKGCEGALMRWDVQTVNQFLKRNT